MNLSEISRLSCAMAVLLLGACSTTGLQNSDSDTRFNEARLLIARGQYDNGIQLLQTLVRDYPEQVPYRNQLRIQQKLHTDTLLTKADKAYAVGDMVVADNIYQQILLSDPEQVRALSGVQKINQSHNHAMMMTNARTAYDKDDLYTAKNLTRAILTENASHVAARGLFEEIENKQNEKKTVAPQVLSAFRQPVTLELKDVPIRSVFEYLSKAGKINFTYDRELPTSQRASLFVRDTSIEDAIEILLTTHQLGKKILNANTILIYPLSRSQEYQEQFVRSFYLKNMDAKRAMNLIKTVVKSKDLYIDEKLNTLVMRDSMESIQIAEKLIASQDLNDPEVILEVEVMEINRRNLQELGVRYPSQIGLGVQGKQDNGNGSVTLTPGRLSLAELKNFNSGLGVFTISDPVLAMNLLQQDNDTNLLANPQIRVKNRDKAKIHVGDKIPVLTSVANSTGFVSQTVSYIDVGIKLDVEPTIQLQNQVSIKVGLEVSNVTDQVKTDTGVLAYTIGSRNANTTLQLKDGETQMLAGLFRDDSQNITNRVPGLGSLPLIGRLFRNNNSDKRKNEIVLLITPRILHNITPVNAVYTSFPSGVNHQSSGRGNNTPQPQIEAPVVQINQAQSAPSPQTTQNSQASADQNFANQLTQSAPPPADNRVMIIQAQ